MAASSLVVWNGIIARYDVVSLFVEIDDEVYYANALERKLYINRNRW
jgi:hypothetical protein